MAMADRGPRRRTPGGGGRRPPAPLTLDPVPANPELALAASAAKACAVLTVPVVALAWLAAGPPGLRGAVIAALLVTGLHALTAVTLAALARRGGAALMAGALGGFFARLVITGAVLSALQPLPGIHRLSLTVSGVVLLLAALVWECAQAARAPGFFWVETRSERTRV